MQVLRSQWQSSTSNVLISLQWCFSIILHTLAGDSSSKIDLSEALRKQIQNGYWLAKFPLVEYDNHKSITNQYIKHNTICRPMVFKINSFLHCIFSEFTHCISLSPTAIVQQHAKHVKWLVVKLTRLLEVQSGFIK